MLQTCYPQYCTSTAPAWKGIGGKANRHQQGKYRLAQPFYCAVRSAPKGINFLSRHQMGGKTSKTSKGADLPAPLDSHLIVLKCSPIRAAAGTARREPLLLGYFSISTPVLQDSAGSSLIKLRGIGLHSPMWREAFSAVYRPLTNKHKR